MASIHNNILTFSGSIQHKRGSSDILNESDYVPAAGELLVATDTGEIRVGNGTDTWANLPSSDRTVIVDNFDEENIGKALDATKGKELHERVSTLEGITGIDCGEISAPAPVTPVNPDLPNNP